MRQRRRVGGRIAPPDDDQLRLLKVGLHGDEHLAHGDVGRDHGKRDVAKGTYAEGIGGSEGKEDA